MNYNEKRKTVRENKRAADMKERKIKSERRNIKGKVFIEKKGGSEKRFGENERKKEIRGTWREEEEDI